MAITEKIELLGHGLYTDIPDVLTLKSLPTSSELDYVSAEDYQQTMLDKILPKAVEEQIDFYKLLDIDYQWICRCLRMLNYGPFYTTNAIFCPNCGSVNGEYRVSLENVPWVCLPDGFVNDIVISRDEFIDFNEDIHIHLLTVGEGVELAKDKMFQDAFGNRDTGLATLCYMIHKIGTSGRLTPVEIRNILLNDLSPADYRILKELSRENTNYGLRVGGECSCPKCNSKDARFFALLDDKFFRPSLGDLREWKHTRGAGGNPNVQ